MLRRKLSISASALSASVIDVLARARGGELTELQLRYERFGGLAASKALAAALGPKVRSVDLRHNELGEAGGRRVAQALRQGSGLRDLDLRANGLRDSGVAAVAALLHGTTCPPLQDLNLWNNSISADGARRLASALRKNRRLETLNLGQNSLEDAGAIEVALALVAHPSLAALNMREAYIGDDTAPALARLLLNAPALRTLDMRNNCISDEGVARLVEGLSAPPPGGGPARMVELLDLQGNEVSRIGAELLYQFTEAGDGGVRLQRIRLRGQQGTGLNVEYAAGTGWGLSESGGHDLAAETPYGWDAR